MQQGLLYHLFADPTSGIDIEQIVAALHEELDRSAFAQAWQRAAQRHAILRTTFRWDGLNEPVQEVWTAGLVNVEYQCWHGASRTEQDAQLERYIENDRQRGFDLTQGPLNRLAVFECGPADYRFVWTFPHALMDGRSFPLILQEVFAFYEAFRQGEVLDLPLTPSYREYISWVRARDHSQSEPYWKDKLRGFTTPTTLAFDRVAGMDKQEAGRREQETRLSPTIVTRLRELAARHSLTLNTFVQAAWAVLLSRLSGEDDVVFGVTRAGRRATVNGADAMVGVFINHPAGTRVPVRGSHGAESAPGPSRRSARRPRA